MNFFKRALRFAKKHIISNPLYLVAYGFAYASNTYKLSISFFKHEEIVDIIKQGKSLIRIGDGEIYIMNNGSIHYQKYDAQLKKTFFEIVKNYSADAPYVIGLNQIPILKSNKELKERNLLNCWLPMKVYFNLFFPKRVKYFDQGMFYYNHTFPAYLEQQLSDEKVVIVTRQGNIDTLQANKNFPLKHVTYIATPDVDAFDEYETISKRLSDEITNSNKMGFEKVFVLAAFGPASKVLAYEYSKRSPYVVVIDIGRGIEILYNDQKIDHIIYPEKG
jgi:hypothetical protein